MKYLARRKAEKAEKNIKVTQANPKVFMREHSAPVRNAAFQLEGSYPTHDLVLNRLFTKYVPLGVVLSEDLNSDWPTFHPGFAPGFGLPFA